MPLLSGLALSCSISAQKLPHLRVDEACQRAAFCESHYKPAQAWSGARKDGHSRAFGVVGRVGSPTAWSAERKGLFLSNISFLVSAVGALPISSRHCSYTGG